MLSAVGVHAQTTEVKGGTLKTIPEELQPVGRKFRGFSYLPSLDVSTAYDNNIYRTKDSAQSDVITTVTPSINILKQYDYG